MSHTIDVADHATTAPQGMESASSIEPMRRWEWMALSLVLAVAATLRLWRLDLNEFGNNYYAAAVRSMLVSPSNFFFGAFDPTGLVTVDKPPLSLWVQAAFAKLLGYHGTSLLLPQALMGTATVALLFLQIRRVFGIVSAIIAAVVLATMPISVAVDRDNLPDPMLTLLLVWAAGTWCRAAETGRWRWLLVSAALIGAAFNVKMIAAYVVLPTFYGVYLLAAPGGWLRSIVRLSAASVVLVLVSLSWAIAVDLTPAQHRPYVGSSPNNSAMSLAIGYNGLGRVFGGHGNLRNPPAGNPLPTPTAAPAASAPLGTSSSVTNSQRRTPPLLGGQSGLLRFANEVVAEQITWLFPLALFGAIAAVWQSGGVIPRTPAQIAILVWSGWLATHWVVFTFARGIFHEYYTVVMGPAVAALVAIGMPALWQAFQSEGWQRSLLPTALLATGGWQTYVLGQHMPLRYNLLPFVLGSVCLGVTGLVAGRVLSQRWPQTAWQSLGVKLGFVACLFSPATWACTTIVWPGSGMFPSANAAAIIRAATSQQKLLGGPEVPADSVRKLVDFLHAQQQGETYLVAGPSSMEVSAMIVHTGEPVIALGGFRGTDPVFTKQQFIELVAQGRLRFVLFAAPGGAKAPPPGAPQVYTNQEITQWVHQHGELVDAALWQVEPSQQRSQGRGPLAGLGPLGRGSELYDLQAAAQRVATHGN